MATETEYKRELRRLFGQHWSCAYETRSGSSVGYPDLQFLVGRVLLPVEVKRGELKAGRIYPHRIRPAQISWQHEFWAAGGRALIVVCAGPLKRMDCWVLPSAARAWTAEWKAGYSVGVCTQLVAAGEVQFGLESFVRA